MMTTDSKTTIPAGAKVTYANGTVEVLAAPVEAEVEVEEFDGEKTTGTYIVNGETVNAEF